ncbi:site-specific integrase [Arcobacter sp. KX21116]|uniref:tyrosine-type recombinase/integrase n=1 Tax=Arcobacter iocasae TaxID=2906515 RepID=UPI0035D490FD
MIDNYYEVENLSECLTEKDIKKVFENVRFPNRGHSFFFDNRILLKNSPKTLSKCKVQLTGILNIYLRVILYFKLDKKMGDCPSNAGESTYFSLIHIFLREISELREISFLDQIDSNLLDEYISYKLDEKKIKSLTIKNRIDKIFDVLKYEEELKFPPILKLDEFALQNSKEYKRLKKIVSSDISDDGLIPKKKESYSLYDLKIIISSSIKYMELFKNEILELAWHFKKSSSKVKIIERYLYLYNFFVTTPIFFTEQNIREIQNNCLILHKEINGSPTNDQLIGIISRGQINDVIERLEVSCISISLMMTGMRVGELVWLDRDLKITHDEHEHLERIVYKTASNSTGEPLKMPIPIVCKDALIVLSKFAKIKDGQQYGSLILSTMKKDETSEVKVDRATRLLKIYCKDLGIKKAITAHKFRHAMAFLITHIYDNEGLELARMFLGHTSITMTLKYMGYYNIELKDAVRELIREESEFFVNEITEQIKKDKNLFGVNGKWLMQAKTRFSGRYADHFINLVRKGFLELIENQKLAIIQTPVSLCIHDLSKPEELICQQGFDLEEIAINGPASERCKGANCSNALFFEKHIEELKKKMYFNIEPGLKKRLEKNTFFIEAGGFEQDPYRKVIKEYDDYKKEVM